MKFIAVCFLLAVSTHLQADQISTFDPTNSLVGLWQMNEGGGATVRSNVNPDTNSGVLTGGSWLSTGAISGLGYRIQLNGINGDGVLCPTNLTGIGNNDEETVYVVIKVDKNFSYGVVFCQSDGSAANYMVFQLYARDDNSGLYNLSGSVAGSISGNINTRINRVEYISFSFGVDGADLMVNGVSVGSTLTTMAVPGRRVAFGNRRPVGNDQVFFGDIYCAALYRGRHSIAKQRNMYNYLRGRVRPRVN